MRSRLLPAVITAGLLAMAGVAWFALPISLGPKTTLGRAAAPPPTIRLVGVVRDFNADHPDFGITSGSGSGHYAGNVGPLLDTSGDPAFIGGGYRVMTEWRDSAFHPIPPHLAVSGTGTSGALTVKLAPTLIDSSYMDSYDSGSGPYDGSNVGPAPIVQTGSPMPTITAPAGLPYVEKYEKTSGIHTLSTSMSCKEFIVKDSCTLRISGNVVVRASDKVDIINSTKIELLPGATFQLWVGKDFQVSNESSVNKNTLAPGRVKIYFYGSSGTFKIENNTEVHAHVISPNMQLLLQDSGELFGNFLGYRLALQNSSAYHHDQPSSLICGVVANDTPGVNGAAGTGAITSASSFGQWFRDVLGVNLSASEAIVLTYDPSRQLYEYVNNDFHIADNRMFGNGNESHNFDFTYEIATRFTFTKCNGLFFEFEGDDDAWLYIDGKLAMDLGGIRAGTPQYVALDRLNLVHGQRYDFNFFYAQRQKTHATFIMRTNIPLDSTESPAISSGYD